jgi:hypothetical protein
VLKLVSDNSEVQDLTLSKKTGQVKLHSVGKIFGRYMLHSDLGTVESNIEHLGVLFQDTKIG